MAAFCSDLFETEGFFILIMVIHHPERCVRLMPTSKLRWLIAKSHDSI